MNSDKLHNKIIDLAIEICQRYGEEAGNWTCTDWLENRELLDAFTKEEKLLLYKEHEEYNSNLEEYDPEDVDMMWSDEMCIAWMIRDALQNHCKIPEHFIDPDDWVLHFASAVMKNGQIVRYIKDKEENMDYCTCCLYPHEKCTCGGTGWRGDRKDD